MSIFSIFDPMTSNFFMMNIMMMFIPFIFISENYWMIMSRWNMSLNLIIKFINNELNMILKKKIFKINFISIFLMILLINFISLFSYIFTWSSHMSMNLSLALPMWLSFILLSWIFNSMNTLAHQVPLSTPPILMPFMVLIEFVSNLIRPLTLSVRLTANMIAGHLILTLISNNGNKIMFIFSMILIIFQSILMILEMSVALIQAYVFTILMSLYSQEI